MSWSGRPLLDNAADAALFVDREGIQDEVRRAVDNGFNLVVVGPAGAGATSLVRRLQQGWRQAGRPVVLVDGRAAGSAIGVVRTVVAALLASLNASSGTAPRPDLRTPATSAPDDDLPRWLSRLAEVAEVRASAGDPPPIAILDGLPEPAEAHLLFGRFRDALWAAPVRWVVTAHDDERAALLLPPADAFFERVVVVEELSPEQAAALLQARSDVPLDPGWVASVLVASASRQPRALLDTARTAQARPELVSSLAALRAELVARLEAVGGRPAVELAAELQQLGGASASDRRLLDRLGWTRPHATRMLRRLEDAGLVVSSELPTAGGGRPRKVYALLDPVL